MDHNGSAMPSNGTEYCNQAIMSMSMGMMGFGGNGDTCLIWLFDSIVLITKNKYIGAVIGSWCFGFGCEMIRFARNKVSKASKARDRSLAEMSSGNAILRDLVAALLFALQMVVAYCLMLIMMLYDVVIFAAVIVGLSMGHFVILRSDRSDRIRKKSMVLADETASLLSSHSNNSAYSGDLRHSRAVESDDEEADVVASPCCANDA